MDVAHHPHMWAFIHLVRYLSYWIAANALLNNLLPCETMLAEVPHIKRRYLALIKANSFFALNWRMQQPSLEVLTPLRMHWLRCLVIRYLS